MTISRPVGRLALIAATAVVASCIGPQGGHREGKAWPTEFEPATTHLFGQVLDLSSGAPLVGAKVSVEVDSATTNIDGRYAIGNIRVRSVNLVTSHEGYDTVRTILALPDGDLQRIIRLRPTPAPQ